MTPERLPERIEADDLVIRRWTSADADAMAALVADSLDHLRSWMAWASDEPLPTEVRLRLFQRWDRYWASGQGVVSMIEVGGELVGGCSLHRRVGPGGLDLGYWLGRHATGRGIATRTAAVLADAAFQVDGVDFVQISHTTANAHSGAVPERLGFTLVSPARSPDVTTWQRRRRR